MGGRTIWPARVGSKQSSTIINHPPSESVVLVLRPKLGWRGCMRLALYDLPVLSSRGIRMIGLWTPVGENTCRKEARQRRNVVIEYW